MATMTRSRLPRMFRVREKAARAELVRRRGDHRRHAAIEVLERRLVMSAVSWTGGGNNFNWNNPANWSTNTVPGASDDVTINVANNPTIIYNGTSTIQSLVDYDSLNIAGGSLTVTSGASQVVGSLNIGSGATLSVTASGATNIDGANLYASGGATLSLPAATSYTNNGGWGANYTLQASGAGSVLSLPNLTTITGSTQSNANIYLNATAGGTLDLHAATAVASGAVNLLADGTGSLLDLSALASFQGFFGYYDTSNIQATNGGTLRVPNLTTINTVNLTTDPTATFTLPENQTFSFTGGANTIQTGTFLVQGNLSIQNNATLSIQGGLTLNGQGGLSSASASTLQVSGNVLGNTTNAAGFNPLGTVVLDGGNGTNNPPQLLEVMSQDLGNVAAGFTNNFAYGTLQLTANTYVELVDNAANSPGSTPQALYVNNLIVPAGATLNLDGLHLYVHTEQINGTIVSGGAVVSGEVYDDVNGNGTLDNGEPGLSGWTVELTNTSTNSTYTTTTNASGIYSLSGVSAGTYTLSEVVQPGFAQTAPASPGTYTITVVSGQTVTGENFGDHPTAAIGGVVFNDLNGDGTLENGEPGLNSWTVQLLNSSNAVIATATTDSGGNYSFTSLLPGTYTVQVVSQSGYDASSAASVTITDDNGQSDTVNFGEFVPVTISGKVYSDSSGSGLSGWTVDLVKGSQTVQTTTGSDGSFSFTNVGPGTYTVEAVQQAGYVASPGPLTETPTSGTNISGLKLGESQTVAISGEVFNDVAGSGTYAAGDQGLSGWTIDLLNSAKDVVASAQTDTSGNYTLTGVGPGTYTVEEVPQSGYIQTTAPAIYSVTVVQGQNSTGLNFGDFQLATVGGELFNDVHDDGTLDPGDPGLAGWTVELLNSASKVVATTAPDSNGDYSFTGVGPGTYSLAEVLQPGYVQTAPSSGGLTVTASSGATFTAEDIGVFKAVSIGVSGLTTTPAAGLQSGMSLVVQWTDTNTGTLPASGSFSDQVVITNTTTGSVLATGYVQYDAWSRGNLTPGAAAAQQYAFSLPDGDPGVGQIQFTVTADYYENVSTPAGESNNTATLTETSTLAPYPDLVTSDVTAPATADPGEQTSVSWTDTNQGNAGVTNGWDDQVFASPDGKLSDAILLGDFPEEGALPAGSSVNIIQNV